MEDEVVAPQWIINIASTEIVLRMHLHFEENGLHAVDAEVVCVLKDTKHNALALFGTTWIQWSQVGTRCDVYTDPDTWDDELMKAMDGGPWYTEPWCLTKPCVYSTNDRDQPSGYGEIVEPKYLIARHLYQLHGAIGAAKNNRQGERPLVLDAMEHRLSFAIKDYTDPALRFFS